MIGVCFITYRGFLNLNTFTHNTYVLRATRFFIIIYKHFYIGIYFKIDYKAFYYKSKNKY